MRQKKYAKNHTLITDPKSKVEVGAIYICEVMVSMVKTLPAKKCDVNGEIVFRLALDLPKTRYDGSLQLYNRQHCDIIFHLLTYFYSFIIFCPCMKLSMQLCNNTQIIE